MAETKTTQRSPGRLAANREQSRRGGVSAPASGRLGAPLAAAGGVGGRGRRGNISLIQFVQDTRSELRKVSWPSQHETVNLTAVVIGLSVAVGLVLGGFDFVFQELFKALLGLSGNGGF